MLETRRPLLPKLRYLRPGVSCLELPIVSDSSSMNSMLAMGALQLKTVFIVRTYQQLTGGCWDGVPWLESHENLNFCWIF